MGNFTKIAAGVLALSWVSAFAAPADEVISQQPDGEVRWFSEKCIAYSVSSWGFVDYGVRDGLAKKTVFAEDGKTVWFRNPISKFKTDTWVKASIEGDQISLPMGQVIDVTTGKDDSELVWTIEAMKSEQVYDEEWDRWKTVWSPAELEALTYTYADGVISQNEEGIMLALFCNGDYMVYGDLDATMWSIDPEKEIVRFPENAETQTWTLSYGLTNRVGHTVEVSVQDNDVYMRGFWEENPNATIKGTIENDVLTFAPQQYIGYMAESGVDYFLYFMPCTVGTAGMITSYQPLDEPLVFDIDHVTGLLTQPYETAADALKLMVKGGKSTDMELYASVAFLILDNPGFKIMGQEYGVPQAPRLPSFCYRYFEGTTMPFCQLEFFLQPFDEEGNVFPKDALTYSMWVDGERVLFEAGEFPNYEKIPEPTYEMPLDFKNNWGIAYDNDNIFSRRVQVPFGDPEKVGAQMIFTDPKTGERKESLIAYYYPETQEIRYEAPETSAVGSMTEADAVAVEYFDMMGARIGADYRGLCVKVIRHADGSVVSYKTVR